MRPGRAGQLPGRAASKAARKRPAMLTFDDIGGQERAKRELTEALDFLIRHEEIPKLGIRPLKGILLTGPPGTGKTLLGKGGGALYGFGIRRCFRQRIRRDVCRRRREPRPRSVRAMPGSRRRRKARTSAIIFIDEIDAIGGKRDGGQQREYDQTLNQLLTEMDGIADGRTPRILLIAATNRKDMLDPRAASPGTIRPAHRRSICRTRKAGCIFCTSMPATSRSMQDGRSGQNRRKRRSASPAPSWRAS